MGEDQRVSEDNSCEARRVRFKGFLRVARRPVDDGRRL